MSYAVTDAVEDDFRAEYKALDKLNEDIDQLASDARDCATVALEGERAAGSGVVLCRRCHARTGIWIVRAFVAEPARWPNASRLVRVLRSLRRAEAQS